MTIALYYICITLDSTKASLDTAVVVNILDFCHKLGNILVDTTEEGMEVDSWEDCNNAG